jgi:AcrR family transcriptional regulator
MDNANKLPHAENPNAPEGLRFSPDALRQRVLKNAEERFLAEGFSRITMDNLAAELGMSKKTLYRHFPSKESLLEEVMVNRMMRIRIELERVVQNNGFGFVDKLRGMMGVLTKRATEVQQPFLSDIKRHAPDLFAQFETFRSQFIPELFGRLIESGRQEGMIRDDMHPQLIVEAILSLIQSHVNPDSVLRLGITLQTAFETILTLIFEGVMTIEARRLFEQGKMDAQKTITR